MTAVISGTSLGVHQHRDGQRECGVAVALYAAVEGKGAPASEEDECEGKDRVKRIETVLESRAGGPCSVAPGFYTDRYNRRCAYDVDGKWETEGLKGPGRKGP